MEQRKLDPVSLDTFAGGAAAEKFAKGFAEILTNVLDLATSATATRKLVLTFTVVPDEGRSKLGGTVGMKLTLAPHRDADSIMYIGERDDQPVAVVFDPRQRDLFSRDESVVPLNPPVEEVGS